MNTLVLSSLLNKVINPSWVETLTTTILRHCEIQVQFIETNNIWCRDFLPVQVGDKKFVQFSLSEDYYPKKLKHLITNPSPICKELGIVPIIPLFNGIPIYLDGGNVVRKYDKVIITNKVFKDNGIGGHQNKTQQDELKKVLKDYLEVEQVIIIPKEPYEYSGHSDGMVRFVNKDTVVINDYSSVDTNRKFVKELYRVLKESGFSIIEVPYKPKDDRSNGIQPSSGVYVNFLQVGDTIFLPTFDDQITDNLSVSIFQEIFGSENIIPVPSKKLSLLGGVLNCISWESRDCRF
jgi:agmatine deiminase